MPARLRTRATGPIIHYHNHHLCRPDIDMGNSFSRLKKCFKHRVRGRKYEPGTSRTGADTAEERVNLPSRQRPHVAASGRNGEGNETSTAVQRDLSRDQSPQPKPMPAGGGDGARQRGEADVSEKKVSQSHLHPDPDVEVVVGSGASREVERVYLSASTEEPGSTRKFSFQLLYLIVPSDNADTSAIPDHTSEANVRSNKSTESNAAANENKRDWKATASETAKLLLRGVNESADVFAPLKSVTAGLCFILDNCEVWSFPAYAIIALTGVPANEGK